MLKLRDFSSNREFYVDPESIMEINPAEGQGKFDEGICRVTCVKAGILREHRVLHPPAMVARMVEEAKTKP